MDEKQENAVPVEVLSGLRQCFAETCRFNRDGGCEFRGIEIGIDGRCTNFEERTDEMVRKYLAAQGLSEAAINHIMAGKGSAE